MWEQFLIARFAMNSEITNDEMLRRYLLDDVSDDERQEIEERFLQDDSLFDEMVALEDELHYEYRQNQLNAREQYHFERKFLQSAQEKEKSAFAGAFLQATAQFAEAKTPAARKIAEDAPVSLWQSIAEFFSFSGSTLSYGLSAAVVLLAFGLGFTLFKNAQLNREVASLETNRAAEQREQERIIAEKQQWQSELEKQITDEKLQGEQNEKRIQEIESEREKLRQEIAEARRRVNQPSSNPIPQTTKSPTTQSPPSFIALALSPGSFTRENGEAMKQIRLAPAIKSLQLRLLSEIGVDFKSYRATLKTLDESVEIWKSGDLQIRGTGAKKSFSITIPAKLLQRADYEISLVGINASGETEEITNYYFSVLK